MSFIIRPARREDCSTIIKLIRELADYEHMLEDVQLTASEIEDDLFGKDPWAHANVAAISTPAGESVVGYVIYFFMFNASALERVAYMEDLYVSPQYRLKGVGLALWRSVAEHGLKRKCTVLNWAVLHWNKLALDFYIKQGASSLSSSGGYRCLRLTSDVLERISSDAS